MSMQLPVGPYIRNIPFLSRFITPRYYVRLREETVMLIEKKRTLLQDTYLLNARGKFSEQEEPLLINAAVLAVTYERDHLRELYS